MVAAAFPADTPLLAEPALMVAVRDRARMNSCRTVATLAVQLNVKISVRLTSFPTPTVHAIGALTVLLTDRCMATDHVNDATTASR